MRTHISPLQYLVMTVAVSSGISLAGLTFGAHDSGTRQSLSLHLSVSHKHAMNEVLYTRCTKQNSHIGYEPYSFLYACDVTKK